MSTEYRLKRNDNNTWCIRTEDITLITKALASVYNSNGGCELNVSTIMKNTDTLVIGQSAFGWHFGLNIYPYLDIYGLDDWKKLFNNPDYTIYNESDEVITPEDMIRIITDRKARDWDNYTSEEEYEKAQCEAEGVTTYEEVLERCSKNCERGLKGLLAHKSDVVYTFEGFLPIVFIAIRTSGTYDLML